MCVRVNREAMFCVNWIVKHKGSGRYPRSKVRLRLLR